MKSKILFVVRLPPPLHGESYINSLTIKSALLNSKFSLDILKLKFESKTNNLGKPSIKKIIIFFVIWIKLFIKMFKTNYDLVYCIPAPPKLVFIRDYIYIFTMKLFRKRIVLHFHNVGFEKLFKKKLPAVFLKFFFYGTFIILHSPVLSERFKPFLDKNRVYFLPNMIPQYITEKELNEAVRRRENRSVPHLLFLSNMYREKGASILLSVLYDLVKECSGIQCVFAGDYISKDNRNKFFECVKNLGLKDCISLKGSVNEREKKELLLGADIFVFPSFHPCESMPVVIIEALQAGLPIVASGIGAIREIIEDGVNGFIFPQKDVKTLKDKISILIKNKSLSMRMGMKGREKFLSNFTFPQFEKELVNIFEDVFTRSS